MFSDEDCQRLCVRLGLSPEATALIAQIRASPPSRRVRSGAGNVCVRYPSRKMGVTIQAESHRVELAALFAMDYDPTTLAFYDQPSPITLRYHARSGRAVTVQHTPDFFVLQADGIGWDEWKPEEQLLRLTQAMPERYVPDGPGRWRCPPGERFAATFGLRYRMRSSAEIDWTLQRNLIFLEDYFRLATPPVPPSLAALLQTTVAATPGLSLAQLYAALPEVSRDAILTALVTGVLAVDLSDRLLIHPDHVQVFPHQAALAAACPTTQ